MKSFLCPLASSPGEGITQTTASAGIPTQPKGSFCQHQQDDALSTALVVNLRRGHVNHRNDDIWI